MEISKPRRSPGCHGGDGDGLRDRIELQTDVQLGKRPPQLDPPFTPPALTMQVVNGLEAWQLEVEALRLAHGTVDRFLQIEVVDLDEVKASS